ncbi:hypothetical protein N8482_00415 [Chitinophagales bacterium]|nr:hypothetical protein [Chitinophagales bacterium]
MYTSFDNIDNASRIWIYQADRFLVNEEKIIISQRLETFCNTWLSHGIPVEASFEIRHNAFVIFAANVTKTAVSGCSIDSSVSIIRELEKQFDLSFFNRMRLVFEQEGEFLMADYQDVAAMITKKELSLDSTSFNLLLNSKSQLETDWKVPISKSWIAKRLELNPA